VNEPFDKDVVVVRRRRSLLIAQLATPLCFPAIIWLAVALGLSPPVVVGAIATSVIGGLTSTVLWLRWLQRVSGRVVADETGATLDGVRFLERSAVSAVVERRLESGLVLVQFERGKRVGLDFVSIEVASHEEVRVLLSTMRLDGARSVMSYAATRGTARALRAGFILGGLALLASVVALVRASPGHPVVGAPLYALLGVVALAIVALAWATLGVTIGADGVRIARAWGGARFISYGQIRAIEASGTDVRIDLANGAIVRVCFGHTAGFRWAGSGALEDQARTLVARVRERIEARASADPSEVAATLARSGRSTKDWVADITRTTDGAASFRVPAVPAEVLLAVVENETAAPDARAGAAVALRCASADPASRERIGIAAEACAEPRLRVALESVARGALDEDLVGALEALEPRARRASRA